MKKEVLLSKNGFSLLECALSLTLMAMVYIVLIPGYLKWAERRSLIAVVDEVKQIVAYARTQAIICKKNLMITPLGSVYNWSTGIALHTDTSKHHPNSNTFLKQWHFTSSGAKIEWRGFKSNHYVVFPKDLSQAAANGRFIFESKHGYQQELILNRLGQISR